MGWKVFYWWVLRLALGAPAAPVFVGADDIATYGWRNVLRREDIPRGN